MKVEDNTLAFQLLIVCGSDQPDRRLGDDGVGCWISGVIYVMQKVSCLLCLYTFISVLLQIP